jgi:uncharacterized protein (DUF1330 family)
MSAGPVFALLQIRVHDWETYQKYAEQDHVEIIDQFGGEFLAIDAEVEVVEGEWPYDRTVVMAFPNAQAAHDWHASSAYQAAAELRHAAATSNMTIVKCLPGRSGGN